MISSFKKSIALWLTPVLGYEEEPGPDWLWGGQEAAKEALCAAHLIKQPLVEQCGRSRILGTEDGDEVGRALHSRNS